LGHKIAFIASTTYAMESIVKLTSFLSNDKKTGPAPRKRCLQRMEHLHELGHHR
jgi:enamine deaminase RidA (YjgF/YER057c/UK114 family)